MPERIYCGSDVIESDLLKANGFSEYPDGVFIDQKDCQKCSINCPKNPKGYKKEDILKLQIERYKTNSF